MGLFKGISYNLRGLAMGLKTPKLLILGLIRIAAVMVLTILAASLILVYHQEILSLIWAKPESRWILWLWYVFSWLLSLVLVGLSAVISYLVSQILFSVCIMDQMSRITEKILTGNIKQTQNLTWLQHFFYLIKQEIPRATIPVFITLILTLAGWLTPFGPIVTIFATGVATVFLAWDNTDLTPARRMIEFKRRFSLMSSALLFHLGFGILFLIPGLNILFLSFAPVGATLYFIENHDAPTMP